MNEHRAPLLDEESSPTPKFEQALLGIFKKYATLKPVRSLTTRQAALSSTGLTIPFHVQSVPDVVENYTILPDGLTRFGNDTNGQPLPEDQVG